MSALYIHIPFCKKVCNYCDFYKKCVVAGDSVLDDYIEALGREMEFRRDFLGGDPVRTLFFGGGTPSVYSPTTIQTVIDKAREVWGLSDVTEITVEANPDDASEEWLTALAATEVNRVSFGVQSFIDRDLQLLGRRHDARRAVEAIKTARAVGFENISIDLMFGIPGMSLREWDRSIMKALQLGVAHISAYHLIIEPGTPLARLADEGKLTPVPEADSEEQFLFAHRILTGAGFDHYEVSNYARTHEKRSMHNFSYWNDDIYLGLGPSAHSYDGVRREYAVSSVDEYLRGAGTEAIYDHEILSRANKYNEFIMLSLRTCEGIHRDALTRKFGADMLLCFEFGAEKLLRLGLLTRNRNDEYRIPPEKMMVSDAIIRELFIDDDE